MTFIFWWILIMGGAGGGFPQPIRKIPPVELNPFSVHVVPPGGTGCIGPCKK